MRVCRDRLNDGSANAVDWVDTDVPTGCQCYNNLWAIKIPEICNVYHGRKPKSCKDCSHLYDCHAKKQRTNLSQRRRHEDM